MTESHCFISLWLTTISSFHLPEKMQEIQRKKLKELNDINMRITKTQNVYVVPRTANMI